MRYFSEREMGEVPRENEEINEVVWGGIQALINARIEDGSFGARYPETCDDGRGPTGSDEDAVWKGMRAEIPVLQERSAYVWRSSREGLLRTLDILDTIEFCRQSIGKPIQKNYHSFFVHYHMSF